jgi:hypothetical protein
LLCSFRGFTKSSQKTAFFAFFELEFNRYLNAAILAGELLARFSSFSDSLNGKRVFIEDYFDNLLKNKDRATELKQQQMVLLTLLGCIGSFNLSIRDREEGGAPDKVLFVDFNNHVTFFSSLLFACFCVRCSEHHDRAPDLGAISWLSP